MTDVIRKSVKKQINNFDFTCDKELTLSMFSGKYKMAILVILYNQKQMHFSELQNNIPESTKQVLSQQLKELIQDNLITKSEYHDNNKRRTIYTLNSVGASLIPLFVDMQNWGKNYIDKNFSDN
ncbi:helix-turn-helix domain-containing protein [Fructobacillus cardui]|uniref:HxlR family (HxlR) n=1 Tax=Fructobacillus cardui TaxID=2893170 RepID=A0ABN9YZY4_9LACO|nr:DNA-binding transcriptional regulator [Fructobacillus cardui]CAK1254916.1 DNA-binding transcriptional regulator [Fructobacillus cardui]